MRTIKFRGKHGNKWLYGDLMQHKDGTCHIYPLSAPDSPDNYTVYPKTVGQFTCVYDPNGKEVWEGDIIGYKDSATGEITTFGVVRWSSEGCFYINDHASENYNDDYAAANVGYMIPSHKALLVIGNVYDNPELLKR